MRSDPLARLSVGTPALAAAVVLTMLLGVPGPARGAAARSYRVPAGIAGNCSTDVTHRLLRWVASVPNNSVLSFGSGACYRIDGTLQLRDRSGLDFEGNGSTFRAFAPPTGQRPIWRVIDSTGIGLHGMTLDGGYARGGTFDAAVQGAAGIALLGSSADIGNVTITSVGGDCVYFGQGETSARTRSSGMVADSSCSRTGRNGIAIVAGNNILVRHVRLTAIGYDVFDVEPNPGLDYGSNGVTFEGNTVGTFALNVYSVVESGPISNQSFIDNHVVGRGLKIAVADPTGAGFRARNITIAGNSSNTRQAPSPINVDNVDGLRITGNTVPMTTGAMAAVTGSCDVTISDNRFPGGDSQLWLRPAACS